MILTDLSTAKVALRSAEKVERIGRRLTAQQHIFEYIECYYNRVRRHSTNDWVSPVNFEAAYYKSIEGLLV